MLTKEHLLRGSAVLLSLVASTGIAVAEDDSTEGSCAPPEPACPPVAQAEPAPPPPVAPQPTYEPTYEEPKQEDMWTRYGIDVALGGGVEGFAGDSARDFTNDGGSWNLRMGIGNKSYVGFEGSYIGSAQSIDALGLDGDTILVGNGAQGAVRVNFTRDYSIQPFAYGGAAWRHYNLTNNDFNTSDIADSDDVFELPVGGGLAFTYEGFLLDARGEYRFSSGGDMMPSLDVENLGDSAGMDRWGVNANIGYQF